MGDSLNSLLAFSEDELMTNREGYLSENQRYRLLVRRRRTTIFGVIALLIVIFVASGLIFAGQQAESPILMLVGIGVTIVSAAVTGAFARHWLRLNADVNSNAVMVAEGEMERVLKPVNRRVITYVIRVGAFETVVSKETFQAFEHGADYRVYYTHNTATLLSAEKVLLVESA